MPNCGSNRIKFLYLNLVYEHPTQIAEKAATITNINSERLIYFEFRRTNGEIKKEIYSELERVKIYLTSRRLELNT